MTNKRKYLAGNDGKTQDFINIGFSYDRQWQGSNSFLNWDYSLIRKPHGKPLDELKPYLNHAIYKNYKKPRYLRDIFLRNNQGGVSELDLTILGQYIANFREKVFVSEDNEYIISKVLEDDRYEENSSTTNEDLEEAIMDALELRNKKG